MLLFIRVFLIFTFFNTLKAVQLDGINRNNIQPVSMISLIANPEKYEGKFVQVEGFCQFGLEESTIYLSRDDARFLNYKNGLHIQFSEKLNNSIDSRKFNRKFVLIEGIFKSENLQTNWGPGGSLNFVSRIELEHEANY